MTTQEFLKQFSAVVSKFHPYIYRGNIRFKADNHKFCPITAFAWYQTGTYYSIGDYPTAAKAIDLDSQAAERIVDAADANSYGQIRKQILNLSGLESELE